MKFAIKNRWTGELQFEAEIEADEKTLTSVKVGLAIKWARKNDADLRGADLRDADLRGADLRGADLRDAYLRGADLRGAYLGGADLGGADLRDADLRGADLRGAYLGGADLRDAYLRGADLRGAYLRGADLGQGQRASVTPVFIEGLYWPVMVTDFHIKIGCEVHTTEEWSAFTDKQICAMDGRSARKFWNQWKEPLLAMARAHQAKVEVAA